MVGCVTSVAVWTQCLYIFFFNKLIYFYIYPFSFTLEVCVWKVELFLVSGYQ